VTGSKFGRIIGKIAGLGRLGRRILHFRFAHPAER
jgi:hypothetical protein